MDFGCNDFRRMGWNSKGMKGDRSHDFSGGDLGKTPSVTGCLVFS
jgi:hypothetical protein